MSNGQEDKLINVREAAKACGRNMETVRRWIWGGKLPAQKLGNQLFIKKNDLDIFCRETAVLEYRAEPDFSERMTALQKRVKARGAKPIDAVATSHQMREERMKTIERGLKETATLVRARQAKLDFLKKATAIRNKIHARTGEVFDAEAMIRELRDAREHELE